MGKELGAGGALPELALDSGTLARVVGRDPGKAGGPPVPYGSPCGPLAFQGSSGPPCCMNRL